MATANRFWHNLRRIAKHKYVPHIKKYATKFQTKKGPYIYIYIYIYEKKQKQNGWQPTSPDSNKQALHVRINNIILRFTVCQQSLT
jgi:hypothetical protein